MNMNANNNPIKVKSKSSFIVVTKIPIQLSKSKLKEVLGCRSNHKKWLEVFTDEFLLELGFKDGNNQVRRDWFNNRRTFWPNETEIIFAKYHISTDELED